MNKIRSEQELKELREKNLMELLDIVLLMMLLVEKVEGFQLTNPFNKMQVKQVLNKSLQVITPIAERDYLTIFNQDQSATLSIMEQYGSLITQLRGLDVPEKVLISQMIEAFKIDQKTMEATIHRVLKKK